MDQTSAAPQKLPPWFKQPLPKVGETAGVEKILKELRLHTVCEGALCPNRGFCFSHGTATFMILGDTCTRNCTFCNVHQGNTEQPESDEPDRLIQAVNRLGLEYVVVTSVTRDDLPDGGAGQFARTIEALHSELPKVKVEVLVPDFMGDPAAVATVVGASPDVFAHNLETVPRLYPEVRPQADYRRSLNLLVQARMINPRMITKSALMLGLGETRDEVLATLQDLRRADCDLLTLGQYLATRRCHPVVRFLPPSEFAEYEQIAIDLGFIAVASAPLVRSSYKAAELYEKALSNCLLLSKNFSGG